MQWMKNPAYQKAIQRLQALRPDQRAVFDSVAADEAFENADVRKRLAAMRHATRMEQGERRLNLAGMRADATMGLARRRNDFDKGQIPIAHALGIGNVAASGYLGYQDMRAKDRQAEIISGLRRSIGGLP